MAIANITEAPIATSDIDRRHILHPFTDLSVMEKAERTVIVGAKGNYVYGEDGRKFLDGLGGMWCVNIGHGRDEMADAIADQVRRLDYYSPFDDLTTPAMAALAEALASHAPGTLNRVLFTTGGSTAADSAIRIAHHYFERIGQPGRRHVITRDRSYHGSTYLTASLSDRSYCDGWSRESGFIHHISAPGLYRRPEGMSEAAFADHLLKEFEDKIAELGAENVAAFIAEPIQGSGGVIVPPAGYLRRMRETCRKAGILYISDEVVTAFGRLGHVFASEDEFGIVPDMVTTAKGLTSGYIPLGAVILSDEIYEKMRSPGSYFNTGFTYSGHAVACAAALKNLEIIEREKLCEHVRTIGPFFESKLAELRDLPLVGDVRGHRLMMCVEYVADKARKELFADETRIGKRIWRHCQKRGLLVRPLAHLNVLSPPLTLGRDEIEFIGDVLRAAILDTADELVRDGIKVT
ncbi:MAG: aminotransferase [Parvibaculum sp.]|uniref:aminotransferase n=1 Tax=Parvibaculum sp. TaxID=2024848 RepID=UPI00284EC1C8|nr:aminotransferase [Parvibaculum sp.]MDR3499521.1 aminotransferase [Parvibaculum sp.]